MSNASFNEYMENFKDYLEKCNSSYEFRNLITTICITTSSDDVFNAIIKYDYSQYINTEYIIDYYAFDKNENIQYIIFNSKHVNDNIINIIRWNLNHQLYNETFDKFIEDNFTKINIDLLMENYLDLRYIDNIYFFIHAGFIIKSQYFDCYVLIQLSNLEEDKQKFIFDYLEMHRMKLPELSYMDLTGLFVQLNHASYFINKLSEYYDFTKINNLILDDGILEKCDKFGVNIESITSYFISNNYML
jgi:hypothetical protein